MSHIVESRQQQQTQRKPFNPTMALVLIILGLPPVAFLISLVAQVVIWAQQHASAFVPWLIGAGVLVALAGLIAGAFGGYYLLQRAQTWKAEREERQAGATFRRNLATAALIVAQDAQANFTAMPDGSLTVTRSYAPVAQRGSYRMQEEIAPAKEPLQLPAGNSLPTNVRYEDVRNQVPRGHILVGIGRMGIETRDKIVGALVWIVGLSGTGKTSTTVLRVEERRADGHKFLGIDPHFFKPESLTNAVSAYARDFLMPIAQTPEEAMVVLQAFLAEFQGRKAGRIQKPWQKITLLVDEVGALMDATTEAEEEIAKLLPSIARICGQEARNFNMGGIFISQQATGLAWLRKLALMVIVHQLLMESEKRLALNGDMAAASEMKTWPIGRTYVYGVGFQDGPRTVQQPLFAGPSQNPPLDEEWEEEDDEPAVFYNNPTVPLNRAGVSRFVNTGPLGNAPGNTWETPPQAKTRIVDATLPEGESDEEGACVKNNAAPVSRDIRDTIKRMYKAGKSHRDISLFVGLSGRNYPLYQVVCAEMGIPIKKNANKEEE